MASEKPLPEIPRAKEPASSVLSSEFRTHRSQLLHHAFEDVGERGIAGNKEGWIGAFEEVLDEVSVCLGSQQWLSGIRRSREAKKAAKKLEAEKVDGDGDDAPKAFPTAPRPVESIQRLISNRPKSVSPTAPGHLLLCVTPHGRSRPLPAEDSGFDLIPSDIACSFTQGVFVVDGDGSNVLFGLEEVQEQHKTLFRLLRFAIYTQLSMVLEQYFLKDSHVQLKIPRPRAMKPSISNPTARDREETGQHKPKAGLFSSGLMGLFTKRTGSPRTSRDLNRGNSIDLGSLSDFSAGFRLRRFSIMGDRHPPPLPPSRKSLEADVPFTTALKLLQANRGYLSTSVGVAFDPPLLLDHLAEKEKENPKRRLKGDEKVGLRALLGWEGRETHGKGMAGLIGFVRQQEISILISQHVPATPPASPEPPGEPSPPVPSPENSPLPTLKMCGKPHWKTYCYFSAKDDKSLGDALNGLIEECNLPCEQTNCRFPRGQHQLRLIHAGVRINVTIDNATEEEGLKGIQSWESCALCGAKTLRVELSNGSWLLSFAKFLELLIYSPTIYQIKPPICDHTSSPSTNSNSASASRSNRFNIQRHFATAKGSVTFSTSPVEDVFELRVPRIQIRAPAEEQQHAKVGTGVTEDSKYGQLDDDVEGEKKALRREIKEWWEGVSDHVDKLEVILLGDADIALPPKAVKALPRLPSSDEAYEAFEDKTASVFSGLTSISESTTATFDTGATQPAAHPTPADGVRSDYFPRQEAPAPPKAESDEEDTTETATPSVLTVAPPSVPTKDGSLEKLINLRLCLQRLEQNLYIQLARTPYSQLNDVRRSFLGVAKGTRKRLSAWRKKHLGSKSSLAGDLQAKEPQWWSKGCHAVPGTNIIVREHDWGSIIAFTSDDYHKELANIVFRRTTAQVTPASPAPSAPSSFFSVASGYRFFTSQSEMQPDPDKDDTAWTDMEQFSAVAMRKEHVRDPTSILSIRDVLRKGSVPPEQSASGTPQASTTVLATRAKPDIGVSMQEADGKVVIEETTESVEKLLHDLESNDSPVDAGAPPSSKPASLLSPKSSTIGTSQIQTSARRPAPSSIISTSSDSDATVIGKGGRVGAGSIHSNASRTSVLSVVPPPPPKDPPQVPAKDEQRPSPRPSKSSENLASTASTFATSIASHLLKFVMNSPEVPTPPASPQPLVKHHGLLHHTDIETIDERPHIKFDWTIGKRLKFSCTVYFAKQFDSLRRRCGIEDTFVKSLSKSSNWAAEGGKSKSNFWKTSDDRFIIKTLVNAWNVADLQFLIDLAPSYFRYMESTTSKATVLAKLLGFYTIEIRNLETNAVQSKVDLLVMENLFYDQNISKTFDLKGIQGRKVKPSNHSGGTTKTLFDNEWIEGQQKTLMLVRPHSKRVLQEAIKSDAEFLAKSNIMDYSWTAPRRRTRRRRRLFVVLVDTIGSYTFAKTIEYKAKHGLQSGNKEVTVMPPADYQERFVRALDGYFVACPGTFCSKNQYVIHAFLSSPSLVETLPEHEIAAKGVLRSLDDVLSTVPETPLLEDEDPPFLRLNVVVMLLSLVPEPRRSSLDAIISKVNLEGHSGLAPVGKFQLSVTMPSKVVSWSIAQSSSGVHLP
ncbi:hypothetical protein NMY22_g4858 [Coprinellus aureogranulatus]|nr:hypothetical protein NMY22_g4858 [Coprinellus aureogranulatus]